MDAISFGMVLLSAFFHAMWNLMGKRSGNSVEFLWVVVGFSILVYLPVWGVALWFHPLSKMAIYYGFVSGLLHVGYFSCLGLAYTHGDFSMAYPILRGTSSIVTPLLAMVLLGEKIDALGVAGIALVILGAFIIQDAPESGRRNLARLVFRDRSVVYAFLAGLCCSGYSLADKKGLTWAHPLSFAILSLIVCFAIMPFFWFGRLQRNVRMILRENGKQAFWAGAQLSFVLVLVIAALSRSKAAYVIPLRQSSILFSVLFGIVVLKERCGVRRIGASLLMLAGVVLLAVAR